MDKKIWYLFYRILAYNLPESRRVSFAKKVRVYFAKHILKSCADTANIDRHAHFGSEVSIGSKSGIGVDCSLFGPITIGNNVMMGPEVVIFTTGHSHERIDIPMVEQGYTKPKPVIVEDDVWIGQRCIIMPGVTIAKGCILGAGSVLTKSTDSYGIYAGVPARRVKDRTEKT